VKVPIPLFGSSLKVQPFLHPERCARVPDGAIGWCAETSTNFGAKHPLTQSGELIAPAVKREAEEDRGGKRKASALRSW
jgi:hypothetical protein